MVPNPERCMRAIFLKGRKNAIHGIFITGLFLFLSTSHASDLVQKVQQNYQKVQQFRAQFVQKTRVELLDRDIEEKGDLILAKPGRFIIHYQGDRERKYISNGKKLWIVYPHEKEVQVFDNLEDVVAREALIFLDGLGNMTQSFEVKEQKNHQLLLTPRNVKTPFKKLVLTISPDSSWVQEVILYPKSGNQTHYWFSHRQTSDTLENVDSLFKAP